MSGSEQPHLSWQRIGSSRKQERGTQQQETRNRDRHAGANDAGEHAPQIFNTTLVNGLIAGRLIHGHRFGALLGAFAEQ